ncbi:MAG: hypothetical protein Q8O64_11375 [Sideroxyarcus sp.]|nr:hypothetical protein [Sideroxyarcus sp.]
MRRFARLFRVASLALLSTFTANPGLAAALTGSRSGSEIGLSLGSYKYEEPGLMSLQGAKAGFDLRTTRSFPDRHTFLRGEARYAFGTVDYRSYGSGSSNGEPDWYVEGRVLAGNDWPQEHAVLSTYVGLGYRFLLNDGRGLTSSGYAGYRRASNYLYVPLGIIHRMALEAQAELVGTIEYDHLLAGRQFSKLSDTGSGNADISSKQESGYGMKLSLMYATAQWSLGPYLHYWNIADSAIDIIYRNGIPERYGLEPQNQTVEFGLQLRQLF